MDRDRPETMRAEQGADHLVETLAPRLYRYGVVRLGSGTLAEDAVAETLCRLVEKGPPLGGPRAHWEGWCVRCMVNVCREMARRERVVFPIDAYPPSSFSCLPAPDLGDAEDRDRLLIAMNDLSERQREAVTLRILMGLPVVAAAQAMGCAEGTIKALTHQGLAALRTRLDRVLELTG